ncbi:hypothetical protein JW906_14375, partial [bacterium]|nr:hypothetical protein [bacterium]
DGHGMDRQGLLDFFTVYRSVKKGDAGTAIGRHGIGKLSIAAIPEQTGFSVFTSTGKEAWQASMGSLLAEEPVRLERVEPVPDSYTRFVITFRKVRSLAETMKKLRQVLFQYVRFLPLKIEIFMPEDTKDHIPARWEVIHEEWESVTEGFFKSFHREIGGRHFEVQIFLGNGGHEIYQHRVFITRKYNLVFHDLKKDWSIPHLCIRVESPDFELPFGRHCLSNEEILGPLVRMIRQDLLPGFFETLVRYYQRSDTKLHIAEMEALSIALCGFLSDAAFPWMNLAVFQLADRTRISLNRLRDWTSITGRIYLADEQSSGMDYAFFNAPVVSSEQAGSGLTVLKENFANEMINLSASDTVIEAPPGSVPELSDQEKRFEQNLGIHPNARRIQQRDDEDSGPALSEADMQRLSGVGAEVKEAFQEVGKLVWKVNYVVERDGRTPCRNRRFFIRQNRVVLNLYHEEIRNLVELSVKSPFLASLAGHWAVAMCLVENRQILPHLTPETREDMMVVDGMSKLDGGPPRRTGRFGRPGAEDEEDTAFWNFVRNSRS